LSFQLFGLLNDVSDKWSDFGSSKDKQNMLNLPTFAGEIFMWYRPIVDAFDTAGLGTYTEKTKNFKGTADALMNSSTFPDAGKRDLGAALEKIGKFDAMFAEFCKIQFQRYPMEARQIKLVSDYVDKVNDMVNELSEFNTKRAQNSAMFMQTTVVVMIIGVIIALILGVVLGIVITKSIVGPISKSIEGLSAGADQLASASHEISSASQSIATGSSQQAANLEEVSSSLSEISSMTKQTADNVRNADSLVKETGVKVEGGKESMDRLQKAVLEIQRSSSETAKILKDIDEIAFQTNLLALNAR